MESNPVLEEALDSAFTKLDKVGKAKLGSLRGKSCVVELIYSGREITVFLDDEAEVYFHHPNSGRYGKVVGGEVKRDRRWFTITFGVSGLISVDGRDATNPRVTYRPSILLPKYAR